MRLGRGSLVVGALLGVSACQLVLGLSHEKADGAAFDAGVSDGGGTVDADAATALPACAILPPSTPDATDEWVPCGDAGMHQLSIDSLHCGECFHACENTRPCNGGLCAPVESSLSDIGNGPYIVRVEGDRISWLSWRPESGSDFTRLWETSIDGSGGIQRNMLAGLPFGFAHGDEGDYIASSIQLAFTPHGSNEGVLLSTSDYEGDVFGKGRPEGTLAALALGGEYLYYFAGTAIRSFRRDRPVGAPPVRGETVFEGAAPLAIAADDQYLFWGARDNGGITIKSTPHGKRSPQPVVLHADANLDALALDATYLFWVDIGARTLYRVPKAGGGVEVIGRGPDVQPDQPWFTWMAMDDAAVYWTLAGAGTGDLNPYALMRTPRCGGVTRVLAQDLDPNTTTSALGIALDGRDVYYGAARPFGIRRITK